MKLQKMPLLYRTHKILLQFGLSRLECEVKLKSLY